MKTTTLVRGTAHYPQLALKMHRPPAKLYVRGASLQSLLQKTCVAIVGSRRMSAYGRQVTRQLASQLAEQGVVIISGLALGVDAEAHRAALDAEGKVIAVLPSSVETVAPATNRPLAQRILQQGGALVSMYPAGSENHKGNFLARNELVAALSQVVVITEAATKSGSLHTAGFAETMNIDVYAVPGHITHPLSEGTNNLIKLNKAHLTTGANDILMAIGCHRPGEITKPVVASPQQQRLLDLLIKGVHDGQELLERSQLTPAIYNQSLTMLEISGRILPLGANQWTLA